MQEIPHEVVSVLIEHASYLDPTMLIPALVQQRKTGHSDWEAKQVL